MRVHLPLPAASQSVTVPANTLIFRKAGLRVAVVQNSRPQLVTVTIARDYGEKVEIISGLRPTDAVPTDECARDVQYRHRQRAHWGDASGLKR
jgi:multidrug efflux pump subunit AcrA (membrane-fusion protein)